jgi:putative DNA primase/helicase
MVERIRARICGGEIIQAIGRGRGVNRTPQTPLEVLVLGDVILPVAVDEFLPDEALNPTPIDLMLAEGGVAFAAAASAAIAYPNLWPTPGAARLALHRQSSVTIPNRCTLVRECNGALVRYRRQGNGQKIARAWFDPARVADPRAAIEAMLGSLAMFELIGAEAETANAANESRGEEREHDATRASMKRQDEQELEDDKAYHLLFDEQDERELEDQKAYSLLFDEDEDSTSVPA